MLSHVRSPAVWALIIGLVCVLALTASLSHATRAEPEPGPPLRLVRATFDPLTDRPKLPSALTLQAYPGDGSGVYLIQFDGPIRSAWKDDVRRLGVRLFDYIPDYAFLAWMDRAVAARAADHPRVRWIGPYQPAYRLSPRLDAAGGEQTVTVLTLPTVDPAAFRGQVVALGALVDHVSRNRFGGHFRLTIHASQLLALAHLPPVIWIEPYPLPSLVNDVARGSGILNATQIWQGLGLYGKGQIVGISDSGLDVGMTGDEMNDDFEGRIVSIQDLDLWPLDGADDVCSGHGTHVAGSVLGNGVNSGSDPDRQDYAGSYAGVAPEAQLVFQALEWALLPPDSCLLAGAATDLNEIFQQAYDDGARLHTNSWGAAADGEYTAQSQQVDQFAWDHPDMTILFAAGNEGQDADSDGVVDPSSLITPGTAKNCITVGASENDRPVPSPNPDSDTYGEHWPDDFAEPPLFDDPMADAPGGMAAFSSRGPAADGRIKPDVVAPGTWVLSAYSQANHPEDGGNQYDGWGEPLNRWYKYMGGTSMATPLVAGAATLVRDYYNDVVGLETPSSALIKSTLINGAYDLTPGQYGAGAFQEVSSRPDDVQGWGRVDLANTLMPPAPRGWWYDDHHPGLRTNDVVTYTSTPAAPLVVMDSSEPLRVSLVWTDYPGAPAAETELVNDLDLEVIAPDGSRYLGNDFDGTGGNRDRINNVEGVAIPDPPAGAYTIVVRGHNVPEPRQPYALVVSGALADPNCQSLTGVTLQAPEQASPGQSVPLTATVAPSTATLPIQYAWAFGDGLGSQGPSSTTLHVYESEGQYTVVVTATNCAGSALATDTATIDVVCVPVSEVTIEGFDAVVLGDAVSLEASVTPPHATLPITYSWNWGAAGSGSGLDGPTPVWTYSEVGTHTVAVTVTNCTGAGWVTGTFQITVYDTCQAPGTPDFAWGPQPVYVAATTAFTANVGTATPPLTFTWRFGDDGSQITKGSGVVTHAFGLSGTFPVTLDVANRCGTSDPIIHSVTVEPVGSEKKVFMPLVLKRP